MTSPVILKGTLQLFPTCADLTLPGLSSSQHGVPSPTTVAIVSKRNFTTSRPNIKTYTYAGRSVVIRYGNPIRTDPPKEIG